MVARSAPRNSARHLFAPLAFVFAAALPAANIVLESTLDQDVADATCTLREAIVAANTNAEYHGCAAGTGTSDRILFELTPPATITLASDLPEITESVALIGPGMDDVTVDGADLYRVIKVDNATDFPPWLFVSGLTLTNGSVTGVDGGAVFVSGNLVLRDSAVSSSTTTLNGGGIMVSGDAVVERSRIHDNEANWVTGGGGILVQLGSLTIADSAVYGNDSLAGGAGGVYLFEGEALTIRSSTISGNSANVSGGGVHAGRTSAGAPTQVTIESSTITNNSCGVANAAPFGCGGGARFVSSLVGALHLSMTNTVVAENLDTNGGASYPDLILELDDGLTVASGGFNFIGDNSGATDYVAAGSPNGDGDFVGAFGAPLDPYLSTLDDHGGPTPTHNYVAPPPMTTHPLADKGSCPGAEADQRGFSSAAGGPRIFDAPMQDNNPDGDACDIGAYEGGTTEHLRSAIFADDFESGRFLFWSIDVP